METKQVIPSEGWDGKTWLAIIEIVIGTALITTGIVTCCKSGIQSGLIYLIVGAVLVLFPVFKGVYELKAKKVKYEYPTAQETKLSVGDNIELVLFTIAFYLLIIGFGVALSCVLITLKYGWDVAEPFLHFGLLGGGAPLILFLFLYLLVHAFKKK